MTSVVPDRLGSAPRPVQPVGGGRYVPRPGRSVRPPDLEPEQRAAVRAAAPGGEPQEGWLRRAAEVPLLVAIALVLAFLIKTFLVQAFYIPSGSMMETLMVNDRVLVEKVSYRFRPPERGEVIVFRRPGTDPAARGVIRSFLEGLGLVPPHEEIDLIKRIVGLPGDTIEITDGIVTIDGVPIAEPYAQPDERDFPETVVPEGHYFLLGDNRGNSDDSRYSLGPIPEELVIGRAFLILWPPGRVTLDLSAEYPALDEQQIGLAPIAGAHGDRYPPRTAVFRSARRAGSTHPRRSPCRPACHTARRPHPHEHDRSRRHRPSARRHP